ncbi:MAG: hypothetical protein WB780_06500 [Candidatus Acidiferrales bacterium]
MHRPVELAPLTGQITNNVTSTPYGSNDAVRVDVSAAGSSACPKNPFSLDCPSGTVTLTANRQPLDAGTLTLNSLGYVEDQTVSTSLSPGNYQLSTSYSGDSSFNPSGPVFTSVTITQAPTTNSITPSATFISSGGVVSLTAIVPTQSFGTPPTGTVTFFSNGAQIGSPIQVTGGFSNSAPGFAFASASFTTTLSDVPMPISPSRRGPIFQQHRLLFVAYVALLCLLLRFAVRRNRRVYVYAAFAFLLLFLGGVAACGGGGGGGGSQSHVDTITAMYSGDTNYSSSAAPGIPITVH